jgi:hypothetical protein
MLLLADDAHVYAVGWITLSMLSAGIAQGKNRSGLGWFAATAILGPIGLFLLVALAPKLPNPEIFAVPTDTRS